MKDLSPSRHIDAMIDEHRHWKGKTLSQLRALIKKADPAVVEEEVEEAYQPQWGPCLVS